MMKVPQHNVTETSAYFTWMGEDKIARTKVKPLADVTLKEAKENSAVVNALSKGANYPIIIDTREIRSISKEARDFFSMNNRESNVTAFAIIIDSPLSRIIGNFFMGLNKPRVPTKLFNTEKEALQWLNKSPR